MVMLCLTISNRKKEPLPWTPNTVHTPTVTNPNLYSEIKRRDQVIKDLLKNFKHKVGDEVECAKEEDQNKYGNSKIHGICEHYHHLEKDYEWPENNNPMLVTAVSVKTGEIFYATTNYFKQ